MCVMKTDEIGWNTNGYKRAIMYFQTVTKRVDSFAATVQQQELLTKPET